MNNSRARNIVAKPSNPSSMYPIHAQPCADQRRRAAVARMSPTTAIRFALQLVHSLWRRRWRQPDLNIVVKHARAFEVGCRAGVSYLQQLPNQPLINHQRH